MSGQCCPCAGDQTGHLLWRLQNGETPDEAHQPAAAVVLIGTNDLGFATRPVRRGGLGLLDPTPCAVGTAVRYEWLPVTTSPGEREHPAVVSPRQQQLEQNMCGIHDRSGMSRRHVGGRL